MGSDLSPGSVDKKERSVMLMGFTNEELDTLLKLVEAKTVKVGNPLATKIKNHLEPPLIPDEG